MCAWRSSSFEKLIKPLNNERNRKAMEKESLQLYKMYFVQYSKLLFNCKVQYLKLINLELYKIIEKFWKDKAYCQFVRAGMNLTHLWKLIINRTKQYLANQINSLKQNKDRKENSRKNLQMSGRE